MVDKYKFVNNMDNVISDMFRFFLDVVKNFKKKRNIQFFVIEF